MRAPVESASTWRVHPAFHGRLQMPEVELAYTMADGSSMAVMARAHPDPRIRALQMQSRESATLQLVERLRLAHAPYEKRVILGCKVPIPGLPVHHLMPWQELKLTRAERALLEVVERDGCLRLSHAGLSADAPGTFGPGADAAEQNPNAGADLVKKYRRGLPPQPNGGGASIEDLMRGASPLSLVLARVRVGRSTQMVDALVSPAVGETPVETIRRCYPDEKRHEVVCQGVSYSEALRRIARG